MASVSNAPLGTTKLSRMASTAPGSDFWAMAGPQEEAGLSRTAGRRLTCEGGRKLGNQRRP